MVEKSLFERLRKAESRERKDIVPAVGLIVAEKLAVFYPEILGKDDDLFYKSKWEMKEQIEEIINDCLEKVLNKIPMAALFEMAVEAGHPSLNGLINDLRGKVWEFVNLELFSLLEMHSTYTELKFKGKGQKVEKAYLDQAMTRLLKASREEVNLSEFVNIMEEENLYHYIFHDKSLIFGSVNGKPSELINVEMLASVKDFGRFSFLNMLFIGIDFEEQRYVVANYSIDITRKTVSSAAAKKFFYNEVDEVMDLFYLGINTIACVEKGISPYVKTVFSDSNSMKEVQLRRWSSEPYRAIELVNNGPRRVPVQIVGVDGCALA